MATCTKLSNTTQLATCANLATQLADEIVGSLAYFAHNAEWGSLEDPNDQARWDRAVLDALSDALATHVAGMVLASRDEHQSKEWWRNRDTIRSGLIQAIATMIDDEGMRLRTAMPESAG